MSKTASKAVSKSISKSTPNVVTKKANTNVQFIHRKLFDVINANFKNAIAINAKVATVNASNHTFTIVANEANVNDPNAIDCIPRKKDFLLVNLSVGDHIKLKGRIMNDVTNIGKIVFNVDFFYKADQDNYFNKKLETYTLLSKKLTESICQKLIGKLNARKPPRMVKNVGIISFSQSALDNFKIIFQELCVGELYVCQLKNESIEKDFINALEYFSKYRQIDIICVLIDNESLSQQHLFDLSSATTIKYLLNRKMFPYLIYVSDLDKSNSVPLTLQLANKHFNKINDANIFIRNIQLEYKQDLQQSIAIGLSILENILNNRKNELFEAELSMQELKPFDPINTISTAKTVNTNDKLLHLKDLVLKHLETYKTMIDIQELALCKSIADDTRIKQLANTEKEYIYRQLQTNHK